MKTAKKMIYSTGMIAVFFYVLHTVLGNLLWEEYNPITTDISSLTADGAPNQVLLTIFTTIYGILLIIFSLALYLDARKNNIKLTQIGYLLFLLMAIASFIGFSFFPRTGSSSMSFQEIMHLITAGVVALLSMGALYTIAFGMKKEKNKKYYIITLIAAIMVTCFGVMNPIMINAEIPLLGLVERITIYSIQAWVFYTSFNLVFKKVNSN
jgi:hypothetical membrane protein